MPTITCTHCSQIVSVDGPLPIVCPSCGKTLHIEGDVTRTNPPLPSTVLQLSEPRPSAYGRYIVLKSLGGGGFGSVFQARDPELDVVVAIKVPRRDTGISPQALERFAREGRNAAQLRHPGIVSVLNVGHDGDLPYIVCEYVEGETLADRLRKGPIDFREAAQIVADVALALDYAHSKGIIHRDIKPSNIMLCPDGKPRLMDFGLAKARIGYHGHRAPRRDRHAGLHESRASLGRKKRQGRGELRHLFAGHGPVSGAHRRDPLPRRSPDGPAASDRRRAESARALKGDIPPDLEVICQKAMRKEPDKRYKSAGAFAKDLERLAGQNSDRSPPGHQARADCELVPPQPGLSRADHGADAAARRCDGRLVVVCRRADQRPPAD